MNEQTQKLNQSVSYIIDVDTGEEIHTFQVYKVEISADLAKILTTQTDLYANGMKAPTFAPWLTNTLLELLRDDIYINTHRGDLTTIANLITLAHSNPLTRLILNGTTI